MFRISRLTKLYNNHFYQRLSHLHVYQFKTQQRPFSSLSGKTPKTNQFTFQSSIYRRQQPTTSTSTLQTTNLTQHYGSKNQLKISRRQFSTETNKEPIKSSQSESIVQNKGTNDVSKATTEGQINNQNQTVGEPKAEVMVETKPIEPKIDIKPVEPKPIEPKVTETTLETNSAKSTANTTTNIKNTLNEPTPTSNPAQTTTTSPNSTTTTTTTPNPITPPVIQSTTPSTPSSIPTPPIEKLPLTRTQRWLRRLKFFAIVTPLIILAGDVYHNIYRYIRPLRPFYINLYIPSSPYASLYEYANDKKHRDELTFKLEPSNLFHNISIYQLLILKDIHTLYMMLDDMNEYINRVIERYETPDAASRAELHRAGFILYNIRSSITRSMVQAELACRVDANPESYSELTQDQYYEQFKPKLHLLEKYWCEMIAAKETLEMLLPLLEKQCSELIVVQTKNQQALSSPEYLQQLAMNPATLPPVKFIPEIPYHHWQSIASKHEVILRDYYKTYITAPNTIQITRPLVPQRYDPNTAFEDIEQQNGGVSDDNINNNNNNNINDKQQPADVLDTSTHTPTIEQTLARNLTPNQIAKRESGLRTSKKVIYKPMNERRYQIEFDRFVDEHNAQVREKLLTQKSNNEYAAERKLRRQRQIDEKYNQLKRQNRVQDAMERVKNTISLESTVQNNDQNNNLKVKKFSKDEFSFDYEVAALKGQLTEAELKAFDKKYPEVAHIQPQKPLSHQKDTNLYTTPLVDVTALNAAMASSKTTGAISSETNNV